MSQQPQVTPPAGERLLPLVQAIESATGNRVHSSTAHRWRLRAANPLPAWLVGGQWCSTSEAVLRNIAERTAAARGETPPRRTTRRREADIRAAERELSKAGI